MVTEKINVKLITTVFKLGSRNKGRKQQLHFTSVISAVEPGSNSSVI